MTNKAKQLPESDPKSYGPKKPMILDLAQQAEILMQKTIRSDGPQTDYFEYIKTGKMRFIGANPAGNFSSPGSVCKTMDELMPALQDLLKDHASAIPFFCHLCHHGHKEIGVENEQNLDGYFFREGTPVPEGADYFDILSEDIGFGVYLTRDVNEDWGKRYDQTRDRILGDGYPVPYPIGYWDSVVKIDEASRDSEFAFGMILPAVIGKSYDAFVEENGMN